MKYGALITAAGLSSRMKRFKPLMEICGISMVQRIIDTFHQSGIEQTLIVTGYRAAELEQAVRQPGIICIRNEAYDRTDMFTSAKIGFRYLQEKCDALFFTPVDNPLFTAETVLRLENACKGSIRVPVYKGKQGHPVYLDTAVLPDLLGFSGEGGLKGAILSSMALTERVSVNDAGICMDADNQEEYERLLAFYKESMVGE